MSDKMPEWPRKPWGCSSEITWAHYYNDTAEAALARMDALVERIRAMHQVWIHPVSCPSGRYTLDDEPPRDAICTCGLSELLAACERE